MGSVGKADPNEAVYDADGNVSSVIAPTSSPRPRPSPTPAHSTTRSRAPYRPTDRSGDTIWTENFSKDWFNAFMFGNGVKFDYTRQDGSAVNEDFTGKSVKKYYRDMSGGKYEIDRRCDRLGAGAALHLVVRRRPVPRRPLAMASGAARRRHPRRRHRPHAGQGRAGRGQCDQQHDPRL